MLYRLLSLLVIVTILVVSGCISDREVTADANYNGCILHEDTAIRILKAEFHTEDKTLELWIYNNGTHPLKGFNITTHLGQLFQGDIDITRSPTNTWETDEVLRPQTFDKYYFDLSNLATDYVVVVSKECPDVNATIRSFDITGW